MERVLTQEERIRRAEEIYLRRRNLQQPQYRVQSREETNPGKSMRLFKRIGLQIIICLLLYCIFYLIYDTNFSFSNATITKTQEILNYNINIEEMYKSVSMYINGLLHNTKQETKETEDKVETTGTEAEQPQENQEESQEQITEEQSIQEAVTQEEVAETQQTAAEEVSLKQIYSLIRPVERRIYIF